MLSAIISSAPEAYRFVEGRKQTKKAKDILKNTVRPDYTIPQAEKDAYAATRYNAATNANNLRAETERTIAGTNAATVAAGKAGAGDSASMMAYLTAADTNNKNAIGNSTAAALQQKAADVMSLQQAAARYGQFQDKAWEWNQKQPYQDAMITASALMKAGKANTFNAINNIAKIGSAEVEKMENAALQYGTGGTVNTGKAGTASGTGAATGTGGVFQAGVVDPDTMSDMDFATWIKTTDQSTLSEAQIQRGIALGILK